MTLKAVLVAKQQTAGGDVIASSPVSSQMAMKQEVRRNEIWPLIFGVHLNEEGCIAL
jgi:hypothetical protein